MTDKIPCRYCGQKFHPRKIKAHEQECKSDQKGGAIASKPKTPTRGGIIKKCLKCGGENEVFKLDGAKCKECGADL
ncbi:MAG: hypothetical protein ABSF36_08610 [Candidatus Methanomethylicaceae archaeon]|jgi:DNA-directed RNA polymerase subunit RPC12/RpoP